MATAALKGGKDREAGGTRALLHLLPLQSNPSKATAMRAACCSPVQALETYISYRKIIIGAAMDSQGFPISILPPGVLCIKESRKNKKRTKKREAQTKNLWATTATVLI